MSDPDTRDRYAKAYERSRALYYAGKPTFEQILAELSKWATKL